VPVAANCCVVPSAMVADGGAIAIETKTAGVTVKVAVPLTLPETALMLDVPALRAEANPCEPEASLMVATLAAEELQYAVCVRSCVVPSVKVPVAVNCCVVPAATEGSGGDTAIETNVAGVIVSSVDPATDPNVALMFAVPTPVPKASPVLPTVADEVVSEDHAAVVVRFCVLPSLYVPVAVNCCVVPDAMEGVVGVTAMETRVAVVTVRVVDPVAVPEVALMVAAPEATPVAIPSVPV
jgi:hypothetical protein